MLYAQIKCVERVFHLIWVGFAVRKIRTVGTNFPPYSYPISCRSFRLDLVRAQVPNNKISNNAHEANTSTRGYFCQHEKENGATTAAF